MGTVKALDLQTTVSNEMLLNKIFALNNNNEEEKNNNGYFSVASQYDACSYHKLLFKPFTSILIDSNNGNEYDIKNGITQINININVNGIDHSIVREEVIKELNNK